MNCNKDEILLEQSDFDCVVDVTFVCNIDNMCKFIREAQETLLVKHTGWGLLDKVLSNRDDYEELLCGSTFKYCGRIEKHFGLKRVLVFYAYGLYALRGSVQSGLHGMVHKLTEDSVPLDIKDLNQIKKENFQLAQEYWIGVEKFLCSKKNEEKYKDFDFSNCGCKGCGKDDTDSVIGKSRIRKVVTFKKYGNN